LLGLQPAFRQLVLLNNRDTQLAEASRLSQASSGKIFDQLTEDALTQIHQGQRYISPIYIDDATSEPLVVMALPVLDLFGDFQGTLAVEVNLKFMWDLVDQLDVGETGYAYVVDSQGNLIAFSDTSRVLRGENVRHIQTVNEFIGNPSLVSNSNSEVRTYAGLLGTNVVGSYVSLGTPEWAVVTELPQKEAYQPIVGFIRGYIISLLVFAVLAGVAGILIARRLSSPLVDLSKAATEVAGGNLAVVAKVGGPAEIAQVASTFNAMTSRLRELIGGLEQRVADRTKALATSAEVSRRLAAILDPRQLTSEVVDEVRSAFDYYYAQIYLLDKAGENLVIAGGTGEAGSTMLARGHSVPKGRGLVGRAADTNASVLVPDVSQEEGWLPNELLPETKAEAAVPISIGNEVLGVLDVQHNLVNGLTAEDVTLLESLAGQVAISLRNARSYEQSRAQAEMSSLVNVIGQKIQRTTSVEDTLQTAIRELGTAIGASRVRARIGDARPALEPASILHGSDGTSDEDELEPA
jgi:putative methionine-R-sulfoxide reductase with GAF domain